MKACSFFGHRDTSQTDDLKVKVREVVERLIIEEGVDTFLFGSRSKFDELCHVVVTELKENYPHIRRIAYLCRHESACLVCKGAEEQRCLKEIAGQDICIREFEEIKKSDRINSAGRASYLERNQWMIDDSKVVLFYIMSRESQRRFSSGSELALKYAYRRKKNCIELNVIRL